MTVLFSYHVLSGKILATNCNEPFRKLISPKCKWTWNNTYQKLCERVENIIKKNAAMVFYNEKEELCLKTGALSVDLGTGLLPARDGMQLPRNETHDNAVTWPIAFTSKSLTSAETCCNNIEGGTLGI